MNEYVHIDLGCGRRPQPGTTIAIDTQQFDTVTLVHDCNNGLPFEDNYADKITAYDFLEHMHPDNQIFIWNEIWRVLKPGGLFVSHTPSTDGRGAWQDPTHRCYSSDTEVLSENGWKLIKDINVGDNVLTINPDTLLSSYETVLQKHDYLHDGKMISFNTDCCDLLVTPNHNMLYSNSGGNVKFKFKEASEFLGKSNKTYIFTQKIQLEDEYSIVDTIDIPNFSDGHGWGCKLRYKAEPLMKLIGWYISEECVVVYKNHKKITNTYRVEICQSRDVNPEKYEIIKNVIIDLGFKPCLKENSISFHSKGLALFFKQLGFSADKYIPTFLKKQNAYLLKLLLEAAILGDGTKNEVTSFRYSSISKRLAADISEIAQLCGFRATQSIEKRQYYKKIKSDKEYFCQDIYHIYISNNTNIYSNFSEVDYKGEVLCLGVLKNHTLFVRRNGRALWSGNSFYNENSFAYYYDYGYRMLYPDLIKCNFEKIKVETGGMTPDKICWVYAELKAIK